MGQSTCDKKLTPAEIEAGLSQFTGTEKYHYNPLFGKRIYWTDGVQWLAEKAGAFWLLDAIASHQANPDVAAEGFQVWILKVADGKGLLTCYKDYDSDLPQTANYSHYGVIVQYIPLTDFPLPEIKLWVEGGPEQPVILLPSEH